MEFELRAFHDDILHSIFISTVSNLGSHTAFIYHDYLLPFNQEHFHNLSFLH
jgi:hypothetical protein